MPLTPEQAAELGLPPVAPRKPLSPEQVKALGLPDPRALPDPGGPLSFARGATSAAQLSAGDEIEGLLQAAGRKFLSPMAGLGSGSGADERKSFMDLYREQRDVSRRENAAAKQHHPVAYGAGEVVGGTAPAILAGAAMVPAGPAYGVAEKLAKAKGMLGAGAALGAASGLGGSEAPTVGGEAMDALKGGAIGAATVPAGALLERGAAAAAGPLRDMAVRAGRKVLVGRQALSAAPLVGREAVQEALDVGGIKAFGTTTGTAERLGAAMDTAGDQYSRIVNALEGYGIAGPDAQVLAQSIAAEGQSVARGTLNRAVPAVYEQAAKDLPTKATGALGLGQAEELKRSLQHLAKYDRTTTADVNDARKAVASMLRQANEDAIAAQAPTAGREAQAVAAQFQPVKQQYGRLAEAEKVAEAGANRIANRAGPNLLDAIHIASAATMPGKLGMKMGSKLLRERGPSTVASGANTAANILEWLTMKNGAPPNEKQLLMELIRRSAGRSAVDEIAE